MIIENMIQGSAEWLAFRRQHITATMAPILMERSKWSTPRDLFLEIAGLVPPKEQNSAMKRGLELEPVARDLFNQQYQANAVPVVMVSDKFSWMAASLDGWDEEKKLLIEIKAAGLEDHRLARQGIIPAHYTDQLLHQMLVSGVEKCYYVSYRPGNLKQDLIVIEHQFCPKEAEILIERELEFYGRLHRGDCP